MVNDFLNNTKQETPKRETPRIRDIQGDLSIHEVEVDMIYEAPHDWNFYKPLNDNKMEQLIISILENGLLNPIIVWEKKSEDRYYMTLSGHNRLKAFKKIFEQTGESKYKKIPAFIKKEEEITELQAQEIIIDTNWVQRELSPMEKAKSILKKYALIERSLSDRKKRKRDIICEDYGLKGRQVENYHKLNFLIEPFKKLIDNQELTIKSGIKIALFSEEIQNWIFKNHKDNLDFKIVSKLKSGMSFAEIKDVFEMDHNEIEEFVNIKVPKALEKQIKEIIKNYRINE